MKVVITGATSFLGQYIVRELSERGVEIYAIIRPTSQNRNIYLKNSNVHSVFADMSETQKWTTAIKSADFFFHCGWDGVGAAGRADKSLQRHNVECALSCLRAASELGCYAFLFTGSQSEYGFQTDLISENTSCSPVLEYGKGKLEAGRRGALLAEQLKIHFYHARIFSVYGSGDHPWTLIPSCIRTLCAGETMSLSNCEQFWNYLYVVDCAKMLCRLMFSGAPSGIYNVAGHDTRPLKEFVSVIWDACEKKGALQFGSRVFSEKVVSLQPDISKLEREIGITTEHHFETEIRTLVQLYRERGIL